ncbi:MAG: GntR family transcriptional regulator [Luteitalea sp.]|nr:GntR family transcriptional regulator [Luteitalea sp.]
MIAIDGRDPTPIYAQLERGLRAAIAAGRLRPGDQLPTVRQLAVDLRVNANTVARVYLELERAGVIETRRGVGSFIRATSSQAHSPRERDRRLRAFVTRVLADAEAAGFTIGDVVSALRAHHPSSRHSSTSSAGIESGRGPAAAGRRERVRG